MIDHDTNRAIAEALTAPDAEHGEPRSVVQWFAQEMERKLQENDYKGGWQGESPFRFANRIHDEWGELADALFRFHTKPSNADAVIAECADIANFALMIADIVRQGVKE